MAQSSRRKKASAKVTVRPLRKSEIDDQLYTALKKIGEDMPAFPGADNYTPLLWDYYTKHRLNSFADASLKAVKASVIKTGILFDPAREQRPVGEHVLHTGVISVMLNVKNPGNRVDTDKLVQYLEQHGVKRALLNDAIEHATFQTRPAHEFKPILMIP